MTAAKVTRKNLARGGASRTAQHKKFSIELHEQQVEALRRVAVGRGISMSQAVRNAVQHWVALQAGGGREARP